MPRLGNPRWDHFEWVGEWTYGDAIPPTIEVDRPEDEEAECLLDQHGEPIVHPKMRFGF